MALDEKLLEILACPNCRGDLDYREAEDLLVCRGSCGYRYPIRDGIPVLLIDEADKPGADSSGRPGPDAGADSSGRPGPDAGADSSGRPGPDAGAEEGRADS